MDEENARPSDPMSSAEKTARLCADVARKIEAISDDRGRLAVLRRGAGLSPGEAPEAWGVLLETFPEELMEKQGAGGRYETAEYIALTSYALSMQGSNRVQPPKDVSIGKACGMFADSAEDPVKKRFDRLVLSTDTTDLAGRLAVMIRLLIAVDLLKSVLYLVPAGDKIIILCQFSEFFKCHIILSFTC